MSTTRPETAQPDETLAFKVGDAVTYENEYGVRFDRTVTGHFGRTGDGVLHDLGYRYLLDNDAWWMPVKPESLSARSS